MGLSALWQVLRLRQSVQLFIGCFLLYVMIPELLRVIGDRSAYGRQAGIPPDMH